MIATAARHAPPDHSATFRPDRNAPAHETIARFCLKEGIAHHDLLPVFRGQPSASFWVHPVDRHPNEKAHRLAAEALAPVVRDLLR